MKSFCLQNARPLLRFHRTRFGGPTAASSVRGTFCSPTLCFQFSTAHTRDPETHHDSRYGSRGLDGTWSGLRAIGLRSSGSLALLFVVVRPPHLSVSRRGHVPHLFHIGLHSVPCLNALVHDQRDHANKYRHRKIDQQTHRTHHSARDLSA